MSVNLPIYLDRFYKTKSEVIEKCSLLLKVFPVGTVWEKYDDIFLLLDKLIELHPSASNLVGPGVEAFENNMSENGIPVFRIIRIDGSKKSFCYLKAIRGKLLKRTEIYRSLQDIVARDVRRALTEKFKEECVRGRVYFHLNCEGYSQNEVFVRYAEENFVDLMKSFLRLNKLSLQNIRLKGSFYSPFRRQIACEELVYEFRSFHQFFATFKLIPKKSETLLN